jgi:histone H2A
MAGVALVGRGVFGPGGVFKTGRYDMPSSGCPSPPPAGGHAGVSALRVKADKGRKGFTYMTRSKRAGLQFPVGRVHRHLKAGKYAPRVGAGAPVYLAAVLEYLTSEVLELAGNFARDVKKVRITPRHIFLAVSSDEEIDELFSGVTIASGGVVPHIFKSLLPSTGKRCWTGMTDAQALKSAAERSERNLEEARRERLGE